MRLEKSLPKVAVLVALIAPVVVHAADPMNMVTTRPLAQHAPAVGLPLIFLLAVVLAGVTVYRLRRVAVGRVIGAALIAAWIGLAGLGYAVIDTLHINGTACMQQTASPYATMTTTNLQNDCPNDILIVDIQFACTSDTLPDQETGGASVPSCVRGNALQNGQICRLPLCL